jgi:hypothetical protein
LAPTFAGKFCAFYAGKIMQLARGELLFIICIALLPDKSSLFVFCTNLALYQSSLESMEVSKNNFKFIKFKERQLGIANNIESQNEAVQEGSRFRHPV